MANGVRQEVVNTFEKGVVKDLNVINTPNNVLTDCVNGTIITYDGNEYQLQNDKGNFVLEYSKLPKGFTPIGTASYGDIIYIVSYNPETKETEIGTFPSPKQHVLSKSQSKLDAPSILKKYNKDGEVEYDYLMENYYQLVQFGATENYKLYPGDSYKISFEDGEEGCAYETIHYYIVTDENELVEITDQILEGSEEDEDGYRYVTWEVPGWLAVRWELPTIEDIKIFPKSINPESGESKINFQITSNDESTLEAFKDGNLKISTDNAEILGDSTNSIDEYDSIRYLNLTYPLKFQVKDESGNTLDTLVINSRPTIDTCNNKILYNYAEPYIIDLSNRFSEANTKIANEYYTYQMDSGMITLNFNIDASVVTTGEVQLLIYAVPFVDFIKNNYSTENLNWTDISNGNVFDGVGQQIIQLELPENFNENILLLKLSLTDGLSTVNQYKTAIASELINNFSSDTYSDFTKIPVSKWSIYLNDVSVEFNDSVFKEPNYTKLSDEVIETKSTNKSESYNEKFWDIYDRNDTSGFFPEGDEELSVVDTFKEELQYKASGGYVEGHLTQKYLYNFCTIKISENSSYQVTGNSNWLNSDSFGFIPNDTIKPYGIQTISPLEDMSETSATTANYSNEDLLPVWNKTGGISLAAVKLKGNETNFRYYVSRTKLSKIENPSKTPKQLIQDLYDALQEEWDSIMKNMAARALLTPTFFYKVEISRLKEIQSIFDNIAIEIFDTETKNLSSIIKPAYFCSGVKAPKALFFTLLISQGNILMLRVKDVSKKLLAIVEDFKSKYCNTTFTVQERYSSIQYKNVRDEGIPALTSTTEFSKIQDIFKDTDSIALPCIIHIKQQNNAKTTVFSSNKFEYYTAIKQDEGGRFVPGILFNDSYGSLLVPLIKYSNSKLPMDSDSVSYTSDSDSDEKIAPGDTYKMNYKDSSAQKGFIEIDNILNSLKVNPKKKTNAYGFFIQKEESNRNIVTDIPIEINGYITISQINVTDIGNLNTIKYQDNFFDASTYTPVSLGVHAVSDSVYHVTQADGTAIDTSAITEALDNNLASMQEINEITLSQYNNYPEFELIKYINAGKSIGYVNGDPEAQPLVTDLIDDILRWDTSIEYTKDTVSKYDIKINSTAFKLMYFVCQNDWEIGDNDFDFEDASDEKSDPRMQILYSIVDENRLITEYYTEVEEEDTE